MASAPCAGGTWKQCTAYTTEAVDFYNFASSLGEVVRELHSIYSSAGSSR